MLISRELVVSLLVWSWVLIAKKPLLDSALVKSRGVKGSTPRQKEGGPDRKAGQRRPRAQKLFSVLNFCFFCFKTKEVASSRQWARRRTFISTKTSWNALIHYNSATNRSKKIPHYHSKSQRVTSTYFPIHYLTIPVIIIALPLLKQKPWVFS